MIPTNLLTITLYFLMLEFLDTSDLAYADLVNCAVASLLAVFLSIFCIDDRYKKTKKFLFISSIIFFTLEGLSMMTVMSDINYQFLVNLFDFTNFIAAFKTNIFREYILLCIGVFFIALLLLYFIYKKVKITNPKIKLIITIICVLFIISPYSLLFRFTKTIFNILYNPNYKKTYQTLFEEIADQKFTDKKDLIVKLPQKPKNLVFIILESFEENFMESTVFGNIASDLKNITNNSEYYSGIPEIQGSNWTMAGIHTLLCGSPRLYNIRKNKLFKTVTVSDLVCFPDVLKKAGYYQLYLGGEFKDFAGKSFFLEMHGYDKTYGDKEIFAEYDIVEKDRWGWGAKDVDVFKIAKDKYIELSKLNQPFNLTFSTISSHAPNGIFDDRCANSTEDGVLNAIECTNNNLNEFINFIKMQENYKDTIIVIAPDHLVMRSNAGEMSKTLGKRTLYVIFLNTGVIKKIENSILYTDVANMVLEKLNIKHNAKFIMYNYKNQTTEERIDFLEKNAKKIQSFNQKTIMQD